MGKQAFKQLLHDISLITDCDADGLDARGACGVRLVQDNVENIAGQRHFVHTSVLLLRGSREQSASVRPREVVDESHPSSCETSEYANKCYAHPHSEDIALHV